jgi:hypothetical protein
MVQFHTYTVDLFLEILGYLAKNLEQSPKKHQFKAWVEKLDIQQLPICSYIKFYTGEV